MRIKPENEEPKAEKVKVEPKVDCIRFEGCTAPICPLDKSFEKAVWYADEDICTVRTFRKEHWRIVQRKIVKLNLKRKVDGFFTLSMLNNIKRVAGGINGLTERQGVINPQDIGDFLAKANGSTDGVEVVEDDDQEE
ncbi:MAG: hypothetical protein WC389_12900 [Lutibacter sp.]|jgi:hypothetical protein